MIVADAGPLLHLFWIEASRWALPPLPIDVPNEVWDEVRRHAPEVLEDERLRRVEAPAEPRDDLSAWNLDPGERAVLLFALAQPRIEEVLILCDEREARGACAALGLTVTGSIGLIVEAYREGRVSLATADAALRDLPGRGRLHVRPELVDAAVAALRP